MLKISGQKNDIPQGVESLRKETGWEGEVRSENQRAKLDGIKLKGQGKIVPWVMPGSDVDKVQNSEGGNEE